MNFDSLEYFSVLARERSFTRAAESLHITQQSLSDAQIRRLHLLRFDSGASYPIRFGYLRRSYQWSVIDEFIRAAQAQV